MILLSNIRSYLVRKLAEAKDNHLRKNRMKVAERTLTPKLGNLVPLSDEQRRDIVAYWKNYRDVSRDLRWFEFYNWCSDGKADIKRYIPDDIYYAEVDFFFTDPRRSYELDDKNMYDLYFHDVKMPRTVIHKCKGLLLDKDYHPITVEQAVELCRKEGLVISKPARNTEGGKGICFVDFRESGAEEALKECLEYPHDLIVQCVVRQHEAINQLYAGSINSLRIMSLVLDGEVHIISSVLRMGRDGAKVDNTSNGGLAVGIKPDGKLREVAFDKTGKKWLKHPQGAVFKDFQLVGYDKCVELVRSVSARLSSSTPLVSWDLAIDEDGDPMIIEANLTFGGVNIHQMCNGPIFGDMTDKILNLVYNSGR